MPMRNPLARFVHRDPEKPTLRQRAATLKASAARVIRGRRLGQVTDQPEGESLTAGAAVESGRASFRRRSYPNHHGQQELAVGPDRNGAEGGVGGSAEIIMGRHETFENAIPLSDQLLSSTSLVKPCGDQLPEPGSDEAMAQWEHASREFDKLTAFAFTDYPDLKRTDVEWWTTSTLWQAIEAGDITPADAARLLSLASERELRMDTIRHRLRIGALHALALANEYPIPSDDHADGAGVNWHNPPAGFMASPAIEPIGFQRIPDAIRLELQRLHGIASAEFARRTKTLRERLSEDEAREQEGAIRTELLLAPLTAATDPGSVEALALAALDASPVGAEPDAELLALGREYEEARAAWLLTVGAAFSAQRQVGDFEKRARAAGMSALEAHKAAWLQDGAEEAVKREEEASAALTPLAERIMRLPAYTVAGLAVKASIVTPAIWASGEFEADRALGDDENWDRACVRSLVEACTTVARREAAGGRAEHGPIEKNAEYGGGVVLYEDAAGTLHRGTVAHWISFMAARIYSVASTECSRQYNARCKGLTNNEERLDLEARIRRELRIDALKGLAFRFDEAFRNAEATRRDGERRELPIAEDLARHFDFQNMPIHQLRTLHDHADCLLRITQGLISMPCSTNAADRSPNEAGRLPDWIGDACIAVWEGCIEEARRRGSLAKDEDVRLAILATQTVNNGDRDEMRDYARDLLALADRG